MGADTTHWLHHPELGELPAQPLVECVFALAPNGRILHFHKEQVDIEAQENEQHYSLTGGDPKPERTRCQIIPPFVNAFDTRD